MKILAFESSAKAASTALLSDGLLLAEYTQNSGQTHSRTLMQMAKDMLTSCDLTPQDIGAVAVAAGPGSFTGVRIGMACAKGFAWGLQLPLYGVSTLEAMTRGAAREGGVLTIRADAAYARLTLTADEAQALTAQGVEKVIFVTTSATSAFRPADLTAYASEAPFVLTHDGETVTFTAGETDLASLLLQA